MKTICFNNFNKRKLGFFLILLMVFSFGCAKKKSSSLREQAKQTAATRAGTGATSATGSVLDQNAKKQAESVALKNGITLDWVGTDKPIEDQTNQNQPYFYVVNVFKVNGSSYEFPTIHYYDNATPINSQISYFTVNGVDIDMEAQCYDRYCQEYLLSLKVSKESQYIHQVMLYVDFQNRVNPVISVNDSEHFLTIPQFSNALQSVF